MDTYREKIIMSYLCIRSCQEDLMDRIVNVGMAGEYKEIGETFTTEDSYEFDIVQFRDTDDITLNTLIHLFDEMENTKDLILNIHAITDDEISEVVPLWLNSIGFYDHNDDEFEDFDDLEDYENWEDFED